jgi:mutator protein MutT
LSAFTPGQKTLTWRFVVAYNGKAMSYVQELRAIVGHRPLILVAAGAIILNEHGSVLLERRTDDHLWGIPGGGMELGESIEETARREVQEETGLVVGEMTLFGIFSGSDMYHEYPNGDQASIVAVIYLTSDVTGELVVNADENLELVYFSADALPTVKLSPANKPIIERFLQAYSQKA